MSKYQCYEFVALDHPLTVAGMAELRSISTRAEITPTRFFNEYHWGDLKADPAELLTRYFDVHVYFANWGSRRLMFRLPLPALDLEDLRACVPGGPVTLTVTGDHVVLDLWSETEDPEEEWFEDGQLLASLTPLRAELLRGDRRVAYVAWLLAAQAGELDPDTSEPRAPHGLDASSASLAALTSFLRVDPDLLAAAAAAGVEDTGELNRFRSWVAWLPAPEQQRWLLRAVDNLDLVPPRPVRRATVTTGTVEIRWAAAPSSGSVNGRAGLGRATLRRRCGHGSRLPREVAAPAAWLPSSGLGGRPRWVVVVAPAVGVNGPERADGLAGGIRGAAPARPRLTAGIPDSLPAAL